MQNLLAYNQAFVLDQVRPMIRILKATEEDQTEDSVSLDDGKAAIADALRLLGNAFAQIPLTLEEKNSEGCESGNSGPCR